MTTTWFLCWLILLLGLSGWWSCPDCGCEEPEWEDCESCFHGEAPSTLTVMLSGMANDSCMGCAGYNDAYIVPYRDPLSCTWYRLYTPDDYCGPSVTYLWRIVVQDATHIRALLQQNEIIDGISYIACQYYWQDTQESFDCTSWDEYEIPYFARMSSTMTAGILCDASGSTLTLTSGG